MLAFNFFSTFASALAMTVIRVDTPVFLYAACSCCKVHRRSDPSISGKGPHGEGGGFPRETVLRGEGAAQGSFFSKGWPIEDIAVVRSDGMTLLCRRTEIQN